MRRYSSGDCCHYEEGYDDGFEDGKEDRAERGEPRAEIRSAVETLRLLSREKLLAGNYDAADSIAAIADEIASDPGIANRVKNERDRIAGLVKLYAASRAAA